MRKTLFPIFDSHLFHRRYLPRDRGNTVYFMAENHQLFREYRYHKHRLVQRIAAMRSVARVLRSLKLPLVYTTLAQGDPADDYIAQLDATIREGGFATLMHFEVEDRKLERGLARLARKHGLRLVVLPSPMFQCSRRQFGAWAKDRSTLRMADFYRWRRAEEDVLMNGRGRPVGGRWSFDAENRKKLPACVPVPELPRLEEKKVLRDVCKAVETNFPDHPGDTDSVWLPYTHSVSKKWLDDFLEQRFTRFGDYQDAITRRSDIGFHSVLSPMLNCGLLTPDEILERSLRFAQAQQIDLNSVEGFVRQLIGWREFVRGVHHRYGGEQSNANFWRHDRELTADWYNGTTGIAPLDDTIEKANRIGYAHHIERLMVVGNLMTLCEIRPRSAHDWFMEMFVDADEWVMGPNVYGMALHSDGGIFASKPYICGSNYLLKMSDYRRDDWCETVDGLFWRFIARNRDFFRKQPRLSMLANRLERIDPQRRERLERAAREFLDRKTVRHGHAA